MKALSIKELEKKTFGAVFQDGLWDVLVGFFMAQFAIGPLLGDLGLNDFMSSLTWTCVILIVLVAIYLLKKHVVTPRIGTVRFKKRNRTRYGILIGVLNAILLTGILMCTLYFYLADREMDWLPPLTFILAVMISFSAVAWLFRQPRYYLFGVLCAVAFIGGEMLYRYAGARHHGYPITFGILSSLVVVAGILQFAVFLKKYPKAGSDLNIQGGDNVEG